MFVLDADSFSNLMRGSQALAQKVAHTPSGQLWLSGIAAEEVLRGKLAVIQAERSRSGRQSLKGSAELIDAIHQLAGIPILAYDDAAERIFRTLPAAVRRVGANDCRTAAIAIAHGLTVITSNKRDFARIPEVVFEDWAA